MIRAMSADAVSLYFVIKGTPWFQKLKKGVNRIGYGRQAELIIEDEGIRLQVLHTAWSLILVEGVCVRDESYVLPGMTVTIWGVEYELVAAWADDDDFLYR